jgi:hypothetical protein
MSGRTADPPSDFAQGRLFGDDNKRGKGKSKCGGMVAGYFLSRGRRRGRMFFATILLPSAVAWVLSACIMPSTP